MMPLKIPVRAVFYREGTSWIIHCLEFDLAGDGATKEEACKNLAAAILLQMHHAIETKNPANLICPADAEIQRKFFAGKKSDVATGGLTIHEDSVQVEHPEVREYSDEECPNGESVHSFV